MFTPLDFDKPRQLRFDIAACVDLEAAFGAPFGDIVGILNRLSMTATCAALWAGLKHEDPSLTLPLVRKKLQTYLEHGGDLKSINNALNQAFLDSTPLRNMTDEAPEGNAEPEPAAG